MTPEQAATYQDILDTVIDNGRVLAADGDPALYSTASLEIEVEYEATDQGLSEADVSEAVAYALSHVKHA